MNRGVLKSHQKRQRSHQCKRCHRPRCHKAARRPPVKRCRHSAVKELIKSSKPDAQGYDFSAFAQGLPEDWPVSLSGFSSAFSPPGLCKLLAIYHNVIINCKSSTSRVMNMSFDELLILRRTIRTMLVLIHDRFLRRKELPCVFHC